MKQKKRKQLTTRVDDYKKAIKKNCYECMGGYKRIDCEIEACALYPFRPFGEFAFKQNLKKKVSTKK